MVLFGKLFVDKTKVRIMFFKENVLYIMRTYTREVGEVMTSKGFAFLLNRCNFEVN